MFADSFSVLFIHCVARRLSVSFLYHTLQVPCIACWFPVAAQPSCWICCVFNQNVQDDAARLLFLCVRIKDDGGGGAYARLHAPPLLKQLQWLPVSSLTQFKLCTLMFDINCGTAPQYQSELVRRCDDTRLWSSVRGNFIVSRTHRVTVT